MQQVLPTTMVVSASSHAVVLTADMLQAAHAGSSQEATGSSSTLRLLGGSNGSNTRCAMPAVQQSSHRLPTTSGTIDPGPACVGTDTHARGESSTHMRVCTAVGRRLASTRQQSLSMPGTAALSQKLEEKATAPRVGRGCVDRHCTWLGVHRHVGGAARDA
jgi:hypothetical protein